MNKFLTPINFSVAAFAVLGAVGWMVLDRNSQNRTDNFAFRDQFAEIVAVNESKAGVVCHDCWLHELNRDHTVPVDIKRYIVNIPRLDGIDLSGSDLTGSYFSKAIATRANLSGTILDGALLDLADLTNADLSGASLRGAILRHANLTAANFRGADLSPRRDTSWMSFFRAEFEEYSGLTDFTGATVKGVDFTDANLSGVKMRSVKGIDSAIFCNTVMPDGDISNTGCK